MAKAELTKPKATQTKSASISIQFPGKASGQFMTGRAIGLLAVTALLFGAIALVSNAS